MRSVSDAFSGNDLRALWQSVYRRAFYLLGNLSAAEDVAQEAFSRFLGRRPDDLANLRGWLIAVCSRIAFDWIRRRGRETHLNETADLPASQPASRAPARLAPREQMILLLRQRAGTVSAAELLRIAASISD